MAVERQKIIAMLPQRDGGRSHRHLLLFIESNEIGRDGT
jgi:hypothetical protein